MTELRRAVSRMVVQKCEGCGEWSWLWAAGFQRLRDGVGRSEGKRSYINRKQGIRTGSRDECGQETISDDLGDGDDDDNDEHCTTTTTTTTTATRRGRVDGHRCPLSCAKIAKRLEAGSNIFQLGSFFVCI